MLEFKPQDGIEVYVNSIGCICFTSKGNLQGTESQTVKLTISQFRSVVKNSSNLIALADEYRTNYQEACASGKEADYLRTEDEYLKAERGQ